MIAAGQEAHAKVTLSTARARACCLNGGATVTIQVMTSPIPASPRVVLRLDRIGRRRAGRVAVQELSLELHVGQVLGLLGLNGAGKSTTLSMIAGALRPDRGDIRLNG